MAFSECSPDSIYEHSLGEGPTLLFSESGFRFRLGSRTWDFHAHLWRPGGAHVSVARQEESPPPLLPGECLYGIDRWLVTPERRLTFGTTVSELVETFFRALHDQMGNAFADAKALTVIRPSLFSRNPPDEGLAVVRLKGALMRAGFPEKQRFVTVFEDLPLELGDLEYFGERYSQFRYDRKEVGAARGSDDVRAMAWPEEIELPFLTEARDRLETRSLFPYLKEWEYLLRKAPAGSGVSRERSGARNAQSDRRSLPRT